ncbi:MAG: methyl-accepting chemotaxis protein [Anaerovoracaceae bacterium]|jgi:methyl-accepting chemotaxis protein
MKSIKFKLLLAFGAIIILLTGGIGLLIKGIVSNQLINDTHSHLMDMAREEAKYVQAEVESDLKYVKVLAQNQVITDAGHTLDDQIAFFEEEVKREGFYYFLKADRNGNAIFLDRTKSIVNVSDRDYFQAALKGTPTVSDITISKADGSPVILFAAPIYENGQITGVLFGCKDGFMLSDIVKSLQYRETGYAYMINNEGATAAHNDAEKLLSRDNSIENAKSDPALLGLSELSKKMITRTPGSGDYTYKGITKIIGYAPVENTPWVIAFGIEESEVLAVVSRLNKIMIGIFAGIGLLGLIAIFFVTNRITGMITRLTHAAKEIASGNFDVSFSIRSQDEVGQLAVAFEQTLGRLTNYQGYIDEISKSLADISQGDLRIELEMEYAGQFRKLKDNLEALISGLSMTLLEIRQASDQLNSGASQVADGAQALSQGATEQASSIQQLSASIAEITEQIKQNAENAKQAREKAGHAGNEMKISDGHMREMVSAMEQINEKASEISKIIKIIDDIAFQTNILALNAAVEAARAGAAGKGFAVVADEVRNLAAKSAEAARNTSALIEEAIDAVQSGSAIADRTAQSLTISAEEALATITYIDRIAEASQDQATAIIEINQGVEQISTVVQTNAATAEESAAASEELSGQSNFLREAIGRFRLNDSYSLPQGREAIEPLVKSDTVSFLSLDDTDDKY